MLQAGYNDAEIHSVAKDILLKMGEYFQIQVCTLLLRYLLNFTLHNNNMGVIRLDLFNPYF